VIQGLIKGERMDWCVQKLVEVGVDRIVLVPAERSVVRLDGERAASRQARMAAIAREAAKQSHRAAVPPVELAELAAALAVPAALRLVCHPAAARPLRDHLATRAGSAAILVGPEGGLAPGELERAEAAGFEAVSLGRGVLRAETAGVAAVSAFRISHD
jgi:16S rRNA (uracil1498-N3)-methyltransferase